MTNPLHHKLKSGRILLLHEPLDADELSYSETEYGNAALEILADWIAQSSNRVITPDDPRYSEMLDAHQVEETP